ncbi:unnamed protein product [Cutaneotrichosporon oleaginosum]
MSALTSAFAKLRPFGHGTDEAEDRGEALGGDAGQVEGQRDMVAGGGHAARHTALWDRLRVSPALRRFLASEGVLSAAEAGVDQPDDALPPALRQLVARPHAVCPPELTDRSHPLCDYLISSSHNTYLLAHQLYGKSCPSGYETALSAGARCVEIDAWDNDKDPAEPKVTHGFTLVSHIPYRHVCETIRDAIVAEEANRNGGAPVFISLENHCGPEGQKRLVEIAHEVFGDRLLNLNPREGTVHDPQHVTLAELGNKVCFMVEYYFPGQKPDDDDSSSSSDSDSDSDSDDEVRDDRAKAKEMYAAQRKAAPSANIIPELSALGVVVQSVKPPNNSWFESILENAPHHHLINISESALAAHLPANTDKVAAHNAKHLMRVYPKGTRISSKNLHPVPFWGIGAQVCALNWQTFGAAMQLNEALFYGTDGFVLKPTYRRHGGGPRSGRKKRLTLRVAGATDVPPREKMTPYLSCTLIHPDKFGKPPKRKTDGYAPHKTLTFLNGADAPPASDPVWDETLTWEYDDDEMVFLRMLLKSDDKFARNPVVAAGAVRLLYAVPGWSFVRLLDLHGRETACTVLVNIKIEDV